MSDRDLDVLVRAWQDGAEHDRRENSLLRQDACEKARRAAAFVRERYGASKTYLYGSLVWGRYFGRNSGIDLLVEGFARPDAYWRMLSELWEIVSPFPPSVVLAEDAHPSLLRKVREQGVELT